MRRAWVGVVTLMIATAGEAEPDPWSGSAARPMSPSLRGPAPEKGGGPIDLPPLPAFTLPPTEPGVHHPEELLVAGRAFLDTDIEVKGYVTWIYDCLTAVRRANESRAAAQRRIDDDPTLCERKKLYLGTTRTTSPERSIWVVSVPRPPNKLERERLPKEELANWPTVPKLAVGDHVVIKGKWALGSPHNERNSDGLLVFASVRPAPAGAPQPAPSATPRPRPSPAAPSIQAIAPAHVSRFRRTRSVEHSNDATKHYGTKQYDRAIEEYARAVVLWSGNHIAWYGMAGSYIGRKDWAAASTAMRRAVEIETDQPMYHMVYGYTLYEAAIARAKQDQARALGKKPEEITVDVSKVRHDAALVHLAHAVRLNKDLWRAHYYIGRIYRDKGEARWAAESFDEAVRRGPSDPGPWVAYGELLRVWGYADQAIAVATAGTTASPGPGQSDVWYVLGMAHDDKRDNVQAISAFTKALEIRPDNAKAQFQRGQAYFRTQEYAKAKIDLEAFVRSGTPAVAFAVQQANTMLEDIAARRR